MADPARADIVVLDEAASALDPPSQDKLMALLRKHLDKARCPASVTGRELEAFHDRKLVMEARKDGSRLAGDSNIMSRRRRRSRWKWRMRRRKKRDGAEAA